MASCLLYAIICISTNVSNISVFPSPLKSNKGPSNNPIVNPPTTLHLFCTRYSICKSNNTVRTSSFQFSFSFVTNTKIFSLLFPSSRMIPLRVLPLLQAQQTNQELYLHFFSLLCSQLDDNISSVSLFF